ncbi:hypothetical protein [Psychromonas sp. SR45-3]|uniref:hypothetical protein n=1 Tax=Psychromonas sp. SR45-3 TaxID=2760930 RepID=UPI0015FCE1B5|nr:hypothetical protein [Psychromonas sp. SR45-3]MBB1274020.1 hypothetical protein [Psychromonas sp. SR45-3]
MKIFTISFVFSVMTLFLLMVLDGELSNLYCVWPLNLIEATGVLGNNAPAFYYDWYEFSMAFSLLLQSAFIYAITSRLMHKKNM